MTHPTAMSDSQSEFSDDVHDEQPKSSWPHVFLGVAACEVGLLLYLYPARLFARTLLAPLAVFVTLFYMFRADIPFVGGPPDYAECSSELDTVAIAREYLTAHGYPPNTPPQELFTCCRGQLEAHGYVQEGEMVDDDRALMYVAAVLQVTHKATECDRIRLQLWIKRTVCNFLRVSFRDVQPCADVAEDEFLLSVSDECLADRDDTDAVWAFTGLQVALVWAYSSLPMLLFGVLPLVLLSLVVLRFRHALVPRRKPIPPAYQQLRHLELIDDETVDQFLEQFAPEILNASTSAIAEGYQLDPAPIDRGEALHRAAQIVLDENLDLLDKLDRWAILLFFDWVWSLVVRKDLEDGDGDEGRERSAAPEPESHQGLMHRDLPFQPAIAAQGYARSFEAEQVDGSRECYQELRQPTMVYPPLDHPLLDASVMTQLPYVAPPSFAPGDFQQFGVSGFHHPTLGASAMGAFRASVPSSQLPFGTHPQPPFTENEVGKWIFVPHGSTVLAPPYQPPPLPMPSLPSNPCSLAPFRYTPSRCRISMSPKKVKELLLFPRFSTSGLPVTGPPGGMCVDPPRGRRRS